MILTPLFLKMFQNSNINFNFDLIDLIVNFNPKINSIFVFSNLIILSNRFIWYELSKKNDFNA